MIYINHAKVYEGTEPLVQMVARLYPFTWHKLTCAIVRCEDESVIIQEHSSFFLRMGTGQNIGLKTGLNDGQITGQSTGPNIGLNNGQSTGQSSGESTGQSTGQNSVMQELGLGEFTWDQRHDVCGTDWREVCIDEVVHHVCVCVYIYIVCVYIYIYNVRKYVCVYIGISGMMSVGLTGAKCA